MNKFEELRKSAEEAASYKAPDWYPVNNPGAMLVNAQTILALLDLIELQHGTIMEIGKYCRTLSFCEIEDKCFEVMSACNQFKE